MEIVPLDIESLGDVPGDWIFWGWTISHKTVVYASVRWGFKFDIILLSGGIWTLELRRESLRFREYDIAIGLRGGRVAGALLLRSPDVVPWRVDSYWVRLPLRNLGDEGFERCATPGSRQ